MFDTLQLEKRYEEQLRKLTWDNEQLRQAAAAVPPHHNSQAHNVGICDPKHECACLTVYGCKSDDDSFVSIAGRHRISVKELLRINENLLHNIGGYEYDEITGKFECEAGLSLKAPLEAGFKIIVPAGSTCCCHKMIKPDTKKKPLFSFNKVSSNTSGSTVRASRTDSDIAMARQLGEEEKMRAKDFDLSRKLGQQLADDDSQAQRRENSKKQNGAKLRHSSSGNSIKQGGVLLL